MSLQVEHEGVVKAQEAAQRAETSLERLNQRYGTIDLDEYNRLKAEAAQMKVRGAVARVVYGLLALLCVLWTFDAL